MGGTSPGVEMGPRAWGAARPGAAQPREERGGQAAGPGAESPESGHRGRWSLELAASLVVPIALEASFLAFSLLAEQSV